MKFLVGLGNPGLKHQNNRHNLGFMVVDEYAKKHSGPEIDWEVNDKFGAEILKLKPRLWLVKPQTFMNNSGVVVKKLIEYFKLSTVDLMVVYDELDLPFGKIKIRVGGSAAGHHGVESIIQTLGSDRFARVRIGIGSVTTRLGEHNPHQFDASEFVVSDFGRGEKGHLKKIIKTAVGAIDLIVDKGMEVAQNSFN